MRSTETAHWSLARTALPSCFRLPVAQAGQAPLPVPAVARGSQRRVDTSRS